MSLGAHQPQQLICAVERQSVPVAEVWLVGGRGTGANPLRVELLGELDDDVAEPIARALEQLVDRHGPHLELHLAQPGGMDEAGAWALSRLKARIAARHGRLVVADAPWQATN